MSLRSASFAAASGVWGPDAVSRLPLAGMGLPAVTPQARGMSTLCSGRRDARALARGGLDGGVAQQRNEVWEVPASLKTHVARMSRSEFKVKQLILIGLRRLRPPPTGGSTPHPQPPKCCLSSARAGSSSQAAIG
ncbi:hypothetical protein CHE218_28120 [Microbacterium sp. che218]